MRFVVFRTCDRAGEQQPCDGATLLRDFKSEVDDRVWVVDVNDVLDFAKSVGESVIVSESNADFPYLPQIEIYDGWRE